MESKQATISSASDKTVVAGVAPIKSPVNQNLIGKCFNEHYLIEFQIGSGGMSDIYRAKDLNLEAAGIAEPYVAIKVLLQQFTSMRLNQLQTEQRTSRQFHIDGLLEQLDLLLAQGRYQELGRNDIGRVLVDLKFLNKEFVFIAAKVAFTKFSTAFDTALFNHDVNQITSLIKVGATAFINLTVAKPYLEKGKV